VADQFRPVFPPDEPILSAHSLEAARAYLDEDTLQVLAVDRARLRQTTAATAFVLAQSLGLSESTAGELETALVSHLSELSPSYQHYLNQLLGNSALALSSQPGRVLAEVDQQTSLAGSILEPVSLLGPAEADTSIAGPEPETDPLYEPADLLDLPRGIVLSDHEKPNRNIKSFVSAIFPELKGALKELSSRELVLLSYQLLDSYMNTHIPQATEERKIKQKQRLELYFGLYGSPKGGGAICEELGLAGPSFYSGIRRVQSGLGAFIGLTDAETMIRKAKVTAEFGNPEGLFQKPELSEGSNLPPNDEAIYFYEYIRTPANMTNFLSGVYPKEYNDRILYLEPWQASLLSYQVIELYRDMVGAGVSIDSQEERCLRLQRWTGLFRPAQDYEEIAINRVRDVQSVKTSIQSTIDKLAAKIERYKLDELFDRALSTPKPQPAERTSV
jgi:hypothetical protein